MLHAMHSPPEDCGIEKGPKLPCNLSNDSDFYISTACPAASSEPLYKEFRACGVKHVPNRILLSMVVDLSRHCYKIKRCNSVV